MSLTDAEFLRFNRQIMLPQVGEQGQLKIKRARVLIIGMGGLGCLVAQSLVHTGVETMTILDPDGIELTNLQRQILYQEADIGQLKVNVARRRLEAINPNCTLHPVAQKAQTVLNSRYLRSFDIVFDCTDNLDTRYYINQQCRLAKVNLIIGTAAMWQGQVYAFNFNKHSSPCFEWVHPRQHHSQPSLDCRTLGIVTPVLLLATGQMCSLGLQMLLGISDSQRDNRLFYFDAFAMVFKEMKVPQGPYATDL